MKQEVRGLLYEQPHTHQDEVYAKPPFEIIYTDCTSSKNIHTRYGMLERLTNSAKKDSVCESASSAWMKGYVNIDLPNLGPGKFSQNERPRYRSTPKYQAVEPLKPQAGSKRVIYARDTIEHINFGQQVTGVEAFKNEPQTADSLPRVRKSIVTSDHTNQNISTADYVALQNVTSNDRHVSTTSDTLSSSDKIIDEILLQSQFDA